ncbi:MAG: SDR family oxidoreductase [Alphaproteobacteria bacterium]|jgi:nucleoside-diphosphate-sugar epimerase|nr:SDR family oxidoreductase [Alphaproteobacteria bacterium]
MTSPGTLFCFGLGYSAMALSRRLDAAGWTIRGTCRKPARKAALGALGISAALFDGDTPMDPADLLQGATHVLLSIPPGAEGDPAFRQHAQDIAAAGTVKWVGYFSTTGVYGNRDGDWVDETSDLRPGNERSQRRVDAERDWLSWGDRHGISVQIFRLPGIYGPGRSAVDQVKAGTARRISKPGHVFSRIHVEDIATTVAASIARAQPGGIYNVCDDEPAAPGDVVAYVCELLSREPPPEIPYDEADMSPMAKSFWSDNRRVRNDRMKQDLGVRLDFPDYRIGIRGILGLGG